MPPEKVDSRAILGLESPGQPAAGTIGNLRGQPVVVVLSPNTKAMVEYGKTAKSEWSNPLARAMAGGAEKVDVAFDSTPWVAAVAGMLKTHFPSVRMAGSIGEAAAQKFAAIVVVDFYLATIIDSPMLGATRVDKRWDGRLDFLVPPDSRRVYRTVESVVQKRCETGTDYTRCGNEALDQMLAEMRQKLDASMQGW
jgi:hypothetical protein